MARILLISFGLVALVAYTSATENCYGQNEKYYDCGACDGKCGIEVACANWCREGSCGCKPGYVRDNRGICILKSKCPKTPTCGPNEEVKGCGACDSTCKDDMMCTMDCRPPECGCIKDHVRDANNKCILKSKCPK